MSRLYKTVIEMTDFGPYVGKIILPVGETVSAGSVEKDTFSVYVERRHKVTGALIMDRKGWGSEETFPSKGYCDVVGAYVSDEKGYEQEESGEYITLAMKTAPFYSLTSEAAVIGFHNIFVYHEFVVTQMKDIVSGENKLTGLVYDRLLDRSVDYLKGWINSQSTYEAMPLKYGYFTPDVVNERTPLIIWLHGGGEGGTDPLIAYTGNKVVNLASEKVQKLYGGGAYVLAPQSPTMWLDNGIEIFGLNGVSIYTEALKALIDEFVENHPSIDRSRIYLGGCSNGGFMTMRLIIDYPGYFAGAYPVCEALFENNIKDEDIKAMMATPIWFTHSKDDTIVDPKITVVPTYERLVAAGHKNVHFTYFDQVVDSRGYVYENFGHATWINMLNDNCKVDYDGSPVMVDGEEVSLLTWLSKQKLQ